MTTFLLTADWRLGLMPLGDAALHDRRFEVAAHLATLAREQGADAVIIAGNLLAHNLVGPRTLQRTAEVLRAFDGLPILILPGELDAPRPLGALDRLAPMLPFTAKVVTKPEVMELAGRSVLPLPTPSTHSLDPMADLPESLPEGTLVIGRGLAQTQADPTIPAYEPSVLRDRGAAEVVLSGPEAGGEHHTALPTHEPTGPSDSGIVWATHGDDGWSLRPEANLRTAWARRTWNGRDDLQLADDIDHILELTLTGSMPWSDSPALQARIDALRERVLHLTLNDELRWLPDDEQTSTAPPVVAAALRDLQKSPFGDRAAQLLHRIIATEEPS